MVKLFKNFVLFLLMFVQTCAPFVHAHTLGLDNFDEHAPHVHAQEFVAIGHSALGETATNNNHNLTQNSFITPPAQGAVVTIASAIKRSVDYDFTILLALLVVMLFLFNFSRTFFTVVDPRHFHFQSRRNSSHNPRAPPR
ncbi:MAG: hypothetical protein RL020_1066 [Pseudomonadota bacterium]|jgi:hypothetical protein